MEPDDIRTLAMIGAALVTIAVVVAGLAGWAQAATTSDLIIVGDTRYCSTKRATTSFFGGRTIYFKDRETWTDMAISESYIIMRRAEECRL